MKHLITFEKYILKKDLRYKNLLYHSTSFENLIQIITSNKLYGTETYDFGVATSRDRNYIFLNDYDAGLIQRGGGECQLILDRDKIKNKYKIAPYNWDEWKGNVDDINFHQAEDKILTDIIINLDFYIVGIQLNKNIDENLDAIINNTDIKNKIVENGWVLFDNKWNEIKI